MSSSTEDLTQGFIVGHHMPGCLPDGEPEPHATWGEAKEDLLHEVNEAANVHLEGLSTHSEEWRSTEAAWNEGLRLIESFTTQGEELAFTAPDGYRYYLERML